MQSINSCLTYSYFHKAQYQIPKLTMKNLKFEPNYVTKSLNLSTLTHTLKYFPPPPMNSRILAYHWLSLYRSYDMLN